MARTYADLQVDALGSDFTSSAFPGTLVGTFLNEAVHRVARRVRIPALETAQSITTVSGTGTVTLPTDRVRVIELYNVTDREPLEEVTQEQLDDAPAATGKPYAWAHYGDALMFYPTPDAAYSLSLRYLKNPAFANPADTTTSIGFPDDYGGVLVAYARAQMFAREDASEMAAYWLGEYERQVAEMKTDLGRQSNRRRQLRSMWDYGQTGGPSFVRR